MKREEKAPQGEYYVDRQLNIVTTGIEEWDDSVLNYNRFESTPYRTLDRLFEEYQPEEDAFLIDYGAGLGRINLYFHHRFRTAGYGLEVHPERLQRARENLDSYNKKFGFGQAPPPIYFIHEAAEYYQPPPQSNLFYFFNPFLSNIFEQALERIIDSFMLHDRQADLILYYPSDEYLYLLQNEAAFEPYLYLKLPWLNDRRECFWIFRHKP